MMIFWYMSGITKREKRERNCGQNNAFALTSAGNWIVERGQSCVFSPSLSLPSSDVLMKPATDVERTRNLESFVYNVYKGVAII